MPLPQGGGVPALPNLVGCFLFMRTPFVALNYQIWRGNTYEGSYLGINQASHPKSEVPWLSNFGILLYLCLHPLKQNDQIRHSNTIHMGRGV